MPGAQVVVQMTMFRFGVRRFERRVNSLLAMGYKLKEAHFDHLWLRTLCYARLERTEK